MWYDDESSNHAETRYSPDPQEQMYCPVCKLESSLGYKNPHRSFSGHCDDCKATYYFSSKGRILRAVPDSACKSKICKCGRCGN
jgi:hypothetical protein